MLQWVNMHELGEDMCSFILSWSWPWTPKGPFVHAHLTSWSQLQSHSGSQQSEYFQVHLFDRLHCKDCLWIEDLWISLLGIWFLQAPLCSFMESPLFYYFGCTCKSIDFRHQFCIHRELRISCWAAPAPGAGMGDDPADKVLAQAAGKISYTVKENAQ